MKSISQIFVEVCKHTHLVSATSVSATPLFAIISLLRTQAAAIIRTLPSVHAATRGVIYGIFREILGDEDGKDKIVAPHIFNLCTKWK